MLFCRPLKTTTKAEDVFQVVSSFFDDKGLQWEKLVGVCTDSALTMLGSRSGFIPRIKQKSPNAVGTHCLIHREALAFKTLTAAMKDKLAIAFRVVNFVKASATNTRLLNQLCQEMDSACETLLFHTAVRWLSKGNIDLRRFLESHWKQDLLLSFTSQEFQLTLAYLVDIFESLNHLNLLLQGRNTNRMSDYNAIRAFIAKLGLWQRRVQKGNAASFPNFDAALEKRNINLEDQLKLEIESHLQQLKQEFEWYFPDLNDTELPMWKMTRNPFRTTEDILPNNLQEEFIEIKDDFEVMPLNEFWAKYMQIYKNVGRAALRTLLPFSSISLCES